MSIPPLNTRRAAKRRLPPPFAAVLLCLSVPAVSEEGWTRFRGPNGSGIGPRLEAPIPWTEKDYNWRIRLPGIGHSQPVVAGGRLFLASASEDGSERILLAVREADGAVVWRRALDGARHSKHRLNSFASSTPATDGDAVYVLSGSPQALWAYAFGLDGKERWRRNLGRFVAKHGHGASPIVWRDLVIVTSEQGDGGESFVAGLERKTGEVRWRTPRRTARAAYSTPCVLKRPGRPDALIFTSLAHGIYALDPASGEVLWEKPVFDLRTVSSPVIARDLIVATCGSGGGGNYLVALRPPKRPGEAPEEVYRLRRSAPYVPTPLYVSGRLYLVSDKGGIASAVDPETGETLWRERLGGTYYASPVSDGERIFAVSSAGRVTVFRAADRFEALGHVELGEGSHTTPVLSGGRIYFRTFSHLISLGGGRSKDAAQAAGN